MCWKQNQWLTKVSSTAKTTSVPEAKMHQHLRSWSLWLFVSWIWLSLCVSLVGVPSGVSGQVVTPSPLPPTAPPAPTTATTAGPLPPTVMPPSPATSVLPPTPLPPTPLPPTPLPPTPLPPTPIPPTPLPPSTLPPTTQPPRPHPDDNSRFYLVEVRIPLPGSLSALRSTDYLRQRVQKVVEAFLKNLGGFSGISVLQMFKVIGEPIVITVLSGGTNNRVVGLDNIRALEDSLGELGLQVTFTPMTSFEAFARAIGAGTDITQPPASRQLDTSAGIHCYIVEYSPRMTSTAVTAVDSLRQIVTLFLKDRRTGRRLDAYKLLAKTPVQFFICENTVISSLDLMFLDLWAATDQPDVTSFKAVREVQSVDRYLRPAGGNAECVGFWCPLW